MNPKFLIVDLFCGAGGTTLGFVTAANGIASVIACVNHDPKAIESHWKNHPEVKHFEEDIRTLDLTELGMCVKDAQDHYPAAKLVLWASLECTNFSKAKGGQPRDADSRTLADHLHRYVEMIRPDYVMIENVVEFMSWGPLDDKGKPVSRKNGCDWLRWRREMCDHGFNDEWREMNSADFGAYTSRNRLFGIFASPDLPICWPEPTHSKKPGSGMFEGLKKWMPVKHVLDFSDEGQSIFTRKKPLSEKTLERIYAGLVKYVAKGDTSFLTKYFSGRPSGKVSSTDDPAPTVTTFGGNTLVQPISILKYNSINGDTGKHIPPSIEDPCPVVAAQSRLGIVQGEFIVQRNSGNPESKLVDVNGPARTITGTGGNQDLVQIIKLSGNDLKFCYRIPFDKSCEPLKQLLHNKIIDCSFLSAHYSTGDNVSSVNRPCPTIATKDRFQFVQPEFIVNYNHSSKTNDINEPSPTILAAEKLAVAKPEFFLDKHFNSTQNQSIDQPAGTIMPNDKHRLVEAVPFVMPTSYDNQPKSVDEPAPTIQASRRHHYLVNPSHGGHSTSIDAPCPVIIARQDKAPLYYVQVEEGPVSLAVYDTDTEIGIKIKQFMAVYGLIDIKMRMLRVHELLKIQGFPAGYILCGNQSDQKKFIGNSVHPLVVKKWTEALADRLIDNKNIKVA